MSKVTMSFDFIRTPIKSMNGSTRKDDVHCVVSFSMLMGRCAGADVRHAAKEAQTNNTFQESEQCC
jgi:hypothetical protein